jgi:hypothetical protein
LAVVFSGSHSQLSVAVSQNGSQWKASPVANITATRYSFVLFTKTGQYYIAYQNPTSGNVMLITSTDLTSWTPVSLGATYATTQRPVLATYQQQLALAFADGQGIVQILTSADGHTWTKKTIAPPISVPQSFAMCSFMGQGNLQEQLYIVFADGMGVIRTRFADF